MAGRIGILALQGDFELHARKVVDLGGTPVYVKRESDLTDLSALIIPGGESTVLLKLCATSLRGKLIDLISNGLPTLATCAGAIFLAKNVFNPDQDSLKLIDIDIERNSYGRQVDSFIDEVKWTKLGLLEINNLSKEKVVNEMGIEGVFIRAPKISRIGEGVEVLAEHNSQPVLVREKNILLATFHPELSEQIQVYKFLSKNPL